jgi:hypothetical protein
MSYYFRIGQQVVCASDVYHAEFPGPRVYKGGIYTISEFLDTPVYGLALQFEEIRWEGAPNFYPGYRAAAFRPVKTTSIEVFTKLLAPTPELVS